MRISSGFAENERDRVASLYWEAFGRKLRPGFADEMTGIAAVRAALQPDHMFVARRGKHLLGICGFYDPDAGAVDLTWSCLRQTLSAPATLRACIILSVLSRTPRRDSLTLDGICVDSAARGHGIGTALLNAATDHARVKGMRAVKLSVIDRNPRARALYERLGFVSVAGGSLGLFSVLYGFDTYTTMELKVTQ